jgi:hypothetical protein
MMEQKMRYQAIRVVGLAGPYRRMVQSPLERPDQKLLSFQQIRILRIFLEIKRNLKNCWLWQIGAFFAPYRTRRKNWHTSRVETPLSDDMPIKAKSRPEKMLENNQ